MHHYDASLLGPSYTVVEQSLLLSHCPFAADLRPQQDNGSEFSVLRLMNGHGGSFSFLTYVKRPPGVHQFPNFLAHHVFGERCCTTIKHQFADPR